MTPERDRGLRAIAERLLAARSVVLTTHVNADGDGAGSEAAVAAWLESRGVEVAIVNPTPFPAGLRFVLPRPELVVELGPSGVAEARVRAADLVLVLDTSEPNRIAPLVPWLDPARTLVLDHHPPGPSVVGDTALQDASAAATGELVYDLIATSGDELSGACALAVYVAIVSDTGSFRFGNTTPRVHQIAAELLSRGVDPEQVFEKLYATAPRRRLELLREALASLETDDELGISWIVVHEATVARLGATPEDFEGLVDHARSVEGTRVAILFRETFDGQTKVSLRANGDTDVNRIAREFGGGGHVKASGATVPGPPDTAVKRVVERVREALRTGD